MVRIGRQSGRVSLSKYVKLGAVGWRYCPVSISKNGRIKPHYVLVKGVAEFHPEGFYSIEWYEGGRRRRQKVGVDEGGISLQQAKKQYFENLEALGKDHKTISAYSTSVEQFISQCKKRFVAEIEKQDLFDFIGWLRKQPRKPRSGDPNRTYYNKVLNIAIFLKAFGKEGLIKKSELGLESQDR